MQEQEQEHKWIIRNRETGHYLHEKEAGGYQWVLHLLSATVFSDTGRLAYYTSMGLPVHGLDLNHSNTKQLIAEGLL